MNETEEPTCAECHELVSVRPGCEWTTGMVCDLCAPEMIRGLRAENEKLRAAIADHRDGLPEDDAQPVDRALHAVLATDQED